MQIRLIFISLTLLFSNLASLWSQSERPNILLILSDDHSLPHLGSYGDPNILKYNLTPHLDQFAEEGRRYNKAYTSAPQCAPSRTSIFAGRSPVGLSSTRFSQPARHEVPFFTDALKDSGYWVGIEGRHHHLDGRMKEAPHMLKALNQMRMKELDLRFDHFNISKTKGEYLNKISHTLNSTLDQVPKGKPFFLYFGFNQPHRKFGEDHEGIDPKALVLPPDWPDLPEVRLDYARFLDEVRDLDIGFGMIEKVLKERNLKNNTLVVFMGDNGEALLRGKGTLFSRGLNVPLLIRWPNKVKAHQTSDTLISGEDLAPTFLAAAGLPSSKGMTGQNFLPEMLGQSFQGRTHLYAERGWHHGPITRTDGFDLSRAIITKTHHYIYNALPNRSYTPVDMPGRIAWNAITKAQKEGQLSQLHQKLYFQNPRPVFELYEPTQDPYQLNNLAGEASLQSIETELREKMDQWMIRESDYLPLPSHIHHMRK